MNLPGITFGPVPSRRLGRSLGINNIPPKVCSYSCIYCQVGRTDRKQISRQTFYDPATIVEEVQQKIEKAGTVGEAIDFLTFVPDGEPTLDENLGRTIDLLKPLGVPIAVISNGSLIWQKNVRNDLAGADWVSLKIDTVSNDSWKRLNRPHGDLDLPEILQAILRFRAEFAGELVSETMLVHGVNDRSRDIEDVAEYLARLQPAKAYLSVPTRPPAKRGVHPPTETTLNMAYQVIGKHVEKVQCLFGYEGNDFSFTGNVEDDLLNIVAVHPMQEEAVEVFLTKAGADWALIDTLIGQGRLLAVVHEGKKFYLRKIK
jgi:wyosine [tRNA(Phe)-imidazoG37] synthetase (radical SAM superfamily)